MAESCSINFHVKAVPERRSHNKAKVYTTYVDGHQDIHSELKKRKRAGAKREHASLTFILEGRKADLCGACVKIKQL